MKMKFKIPFDYEWQEFLHRSFLQKVRDHLLPFRRSSGKTEIRYSWGEQERRKLFCNFFSIMFPRISHLVEFNLSLGMFLLIK